jgi:hypothetical protein
MEKLKTWIVSFIIAMIVLGLGHFWGDKEVRQHSTGFVVTYFPFFMAFEAFLLYWAIIGMYKGFKKSSKPYGKTIISTKYDDKDLISFKNLYNRRILNNSTSLSPYETPAEDIIKWAKEPDNSTYINRFAFAKKDSELFGFIFATYYLRAKLSFVSYLVINDKIKEARTIDIQDRLVAQLFEFENKQFKQIQGVVAEVEYDNNTSNDRSNKKIRDFKALSRTFGYKLWTLWDVPSKEPDPSPATSSSANERQIVLLYIRTKNNPKSKSNEPPTKAEIENILKFVYLNVYYDSHIDDDNLCKKYRTYLDGLYKRVWAEYESKQLNQSMPHPSI